VTDDACPQHSCAPRGRACGEQQSPCPNRVRPVRPLDEAVLTTRETPPTGHHPEAIPRRRTPTPDDIGDVRQHAPRRQKIVPFVTGPTKQNRPDRQRAGDPAQEKWLYSAYGAFRALLFGPPSPHHPQSPAPKRAASRPASSPQPENQPPTEARCSN
jgi:hypothetical protein